MSSALPNRAHMTIGEVLARLQPQFPDVTISKIRFLESEGLVEPERTPSGYRKFTPDDVERLRYVLAAQRDRYLPLRVIREQLDSLDSGGPAPYPEGPAQVGRLPGPESFTEPAPVRLTREELVARSGLTADQLATLEEYGLVTRRAGAGGYDEDALVIARTVAELAAYGIEPRHLRGFRAAADREVGMVEQVVAPLLRQRGERAGDARARADETGRALAALFVRLHAALVKSRLGPTLGR